MGKCCLVMRIEIERLAIELDRAPSIACGIANQAEEHKRVGGRAGVVEVALAKAGRLNEMSGIRHLFNLGQADLEWEGHRRRLRRISRQARLGVALKRGEVGTRRRHCWTSAERDCRGRSGLRCCRRSLFPKGKGHRRLDGNEAVFESQICLGRPDKEVSAGTDETRQRKERTVLRGGIEIDQQVSAEDDIVRSPRRQIRIEQIAHSETNATSYGLG